jgi:hypothetical protein
MKIIKIAGRAKRANLNGNTIEREEIIYVPSERGWFRIMDTQEHFCYRQNQFLGPTLMCSCGSTAGLFTFDAYRQFQSTNYGKMVCCVSYIQTRRHADGVSG